MVLPVPISIKNKLTINCKLYLYNCNTCDICFCAKFALESILIAVAAEDMSDRPHELNLERENSDEDDSESMEKFDSILDQSRC